MPGADSQGKKIYAQEILAGSGVRERGRPYCTVRLDRRRMKMAIGVADDLRAKAEGAEDDKDVFDVGHGRISCVRGEVAATGRRRDPEIGGITRRCRISRRSGGPWLRRFVAAGLGRACGRACGAAGALACCCCRVGCSSLLVSFLASFFASFFASVLATGGSGWGSASAESRPARRRRARGRGSRRPGRRRKPEAGRKSGSVCASEVSMFDARYLR